MLKEWRKLKSNVKIKKFWIFFQRYFCYEKIDYVKFKINRLVLFCAFVSTVQTIEMRPWMRLLNEKFVWNTLFLLKDWILTKGTEKLRNKDVNLCILFRYITKQKNSEHFSMICGCKIPTCLSMPVAPFVQIAEQSTTTTKKANKFETTITSIVATLSCPWHRITTNFIRTFNIRLNTRAYLSKPFVKNNNNII